MKASSKWPILALLVGVVLYASAVANLSAQRQRFSTDYVPDVVLPAGVQLTLAAGDRYLAANLNVFRILISSLNKPSPETAGALASLHKQAAQFNPGHEDNYYLATATLPWWGQLDAAQAVLQQAADARPADVYPLFFLGFNYQYFEGKFFEAARALERAAERADLDNRPALLAIAAKWQEKHSDLALNIRLLRGMKQRSRDPGLRRLLEFRAVRLEGLQALRNAQRAFEQKTGQKLSSLEQLRDLRLIKRLPVDPLAGGYRLNGKGEVELLPPKI